VEWSSNLGPAGSLFLAFEDLAPAGVPGAAHRKLGTRGTRLDGAGMAVST